MAPARPPDSAHAHRHCRFPLPEETARKTLLTPGRKMPPKSELTDIKKELVEKEKTEKKEQLCEKYDMTRSELEVLLSNTYRYDPVLGTGAYSGSPPHRRILWSS